MRDRGLPVLPHQHDALNRAGEALDAIRPHASTDLQNALQRQPELIHEAAEGRSQAAVQAMNKEAELRADPFQRSEEHTSELQSLMRISYAVFCLKKKTKTTKSYKNYASHTVTTHTSTRSSTTHTS